MLSADTKIKCIGGVYYDDCLNFRKQIGEDLESYEEWLHQYFKANGVTDGDKKVAVFLTVIGSHLYKLLRNLVSPSKPAEKSYEELTTVKQHLVAKQIVIAERLKFENGFKSQVRILQHIWHP